MSSKARIDAYLDCNSPYSFYAFTWLKRHKAELLEHGVEVALHPIFLGGINVGSGNKPPWTLPAKAAYSKYDGARAARYFNVEHLKAPEFFPIMTLLPMRCLLYIKDRFSTDRYEDLFGELWQAYWHDALDISKPENMRECLRRHFNDKEVDSIIEGGTSPKYKKLLTDETAKLVAKGAFGAPWYLVTNKDGKEEPFFGSDRFAYMLQYLNVPFTDITIAPPSQGIAGPESKL